jgi:esterase FrsA
LPRIPHLKGDELAEQAQALANRAYEEAAQRLPGQMRELEFTIPGGARYRVPAYA